MSRYSDLISLQGATAHWELEETGSTYTDRIAGIVLTKYGDPGTQLAVVNNGATFSGNRYSQATESLLNFTVANPFSYSFVFRCDNTTLTQGIVARRTSATVARSWGAFIFNTGFFAVDFGGNQARWTTTWSPVQERTYHIAITWNPATSNYSLYVDGDLKASSGVMSPTNSNITSTFNIGVLGGGETSQNLRGMVDEVAVWKNKLLSPEEIKAQYATAFPIMRIFDGTTWKDADRRVL